MHRRLVLALLISLCAFPAAASGGGEKKAETDSVRAVDISTIGAPIVWKGRLVNYVFVQSRLKLQPGADATKLKAQEPFFRDALVRAAHRTPFVDPHDLSRIDERAFTAALMREASRIAGPKAFASAEVKSQQARQRTGLPATGTNRPQGRAITP